MNRKMELLYRRAEWLSAMQAARKGDLSLAEQEALTEGWKLILTNQFHDIIPGSSIHEVYEDSRKDYAKIEQIAEQVVDHYLEQSVSEEMCIRDRLADEPTGNLDSKTAVEVIGLLKASSQKYHQTVLMVTHNEALAQTCDRIIRIEDGRLYQREDAFYGEGGEL